MDINFHNQDKHWVLVILGKVRNFALPILKAFIICLKWLGRQLQKRWKILVGIVAAVIIISVGLWGYDYYKYTYIPKKLLDEAVTDITNKLESYEGEEKANYAYHILTDYDFGYDNVDNGDIRSMIFPLFKPAFNFIEEQAFNGNSRCQYMLALLYYWENNYVQANPEREAYWLTEAANQGYSSAYNNLGLCYKEGRGVSQDMNKAIMWLKKGAESGHHSAQKNYGDLFVEGVRVKVGTHKETRKTADYYYGSKNDIVRQYYDNNTNCNIVTVYLETVNDYKQVIPKDIEHARFWWKKAASQGNMAAKEALQKIYD